MRLFVMIFLFAFMETAASPQQQSSAKDADVQRFDGTWGVTLTCADFKDAKGGAKGYKYRFLAHVKDGVLSGEHGRENESGWLRYDGRIERDGTATISAKGITGDPQTSVGQISRGTPYSYRVKAEFEESSGRGTRVDLRPCDVIFIKQ